MYNQVRLHVYRPDLNSPTYYSKFYYVTYVSGKRFRFNDYMDAFNIHYFKRSKSFSITCYLPQTLVDIKVYTRFFTLNPIANQLTLF